MRERRRRSLGGGDGDGMSRIENEVVVIFPLRIARRSARLRESFEEGNTHLVENLSSERCSVLRRQMLFDEFKRAEEFLAFHAAVLRSGVLQLDVILADLVQFPIAERSAKNSDRSEIQSTRRCRVLHIASDPDPRPRREVRVVCRASRRSPR